MPQMDNNNNTEKAKNSFVEFLKYALLAAIVVIPFRIFVAQPYIVSGSSMDPTFKNNDYLIVDQLSKRLSEYKRGEVIIIRYPKDPSKFFIKRLIAFPNEEVKIINGKVFIYNYDNPEGFEFDEPYVNYKKNENFSAFLGYGEYFVMGDNRAASSDSRVWGSLPKENIIGKPILRLFPFNKIDFMPGNINKFLNNNLN